MATTIRKRRHRNAPVDDDHLILLADGDKSLLQNRFSPFTLDRVAADLWREYGDSIVAAWIRHSPGSRPSWWWRLSAPRLPESEHGQFAGTVWAPAMIELRRHLSGDGFPAWERYCLSYDQHFGLPTWCGDPDQPPQFETQFSYLKRHGLLLTGERSPIREPQPTPRFWQ